MRSLAEGSLRKLSQSDSWAPSLPPDLTILSDAVIQTLQSIYGAEFVAEWTEESLETETQAKHRYKMHCDGKFTGLDAVEVEEAIRRERPAYGRRARAYSDVYDRLAAAFGNGQLILFAVGREEGSGKPFREECRFNGLDEFQTEVLLREGNLRNIGDPRDFAVDKECFSRWLNPVAAAQPPQSQPALEPTVRKRKLPDPGADALLRNRIETVLSCARGKLRDGLAKRQLARLVWESSSASDFGEETIRKIIGGEYKPQIRLGIAGLSG
jgi:hypothetical protein